MPNNLSYWGGIEPSAAKYKGHQGLAGVGLEQYDNWKDRWAEAIEREKRILWAQQQDAISGPYKKSLSEEEIAEIALERVMETIPGGAVAGAIKGMKPQRLSRLYHGTPSEDAVDSILKKGFTRGRSAELDLPGTSTSRDPLVSLTHFGMNNPSNVLKVRPQVPASEVRNLRPSEYTKGITPKEGLYGKPQMHFRESEVYGLRKEVPRVVDNKRLSQSLNNAQEDLYNIQRARVDAQDSLEITEQELFRLKDSGKPYDKLYKKRMDLWHKRDSLEDAEEVAFNKVAKINKLIQRQGKVQQVKELPPLKPEKMPKNEKAFMKYGANVLKRYRVQEENISNQINSYLTHVPSEPLKYELTRDIRQALTNLNALRGFSGTYESTLQYAPIESTHLLDTLMGLNYKTARRLLRLPNSQFNAKSWDNLRKRLVKIKTNKMDLPRAYEQYRNDLISADEFDNFYRQVKKDRNEGMDAVNKLFGVE